VTQRVGLTHPCLERALTELQSGAPISPHIASAVQQLVSELDSKYFELQEQAEAGRISRAEVSGAFGLARAANSVLSALSEDAAEAAYEAIAATDALAEVRKIVLSALTHGVQT
jgi:hypothetical protein